MKNTVNSTAVILLALTLAACSRSESPVTTDPVDTTPPTTEPAPATEQAAEPVKPADPKPDTDNTPDNATLAKWMGKWIGVEATYLTIKPADEFYGIELADLDGPKMYKGTGRGDHISFERNGKTETIRATDGDGTGMKWLAGKKDCLVITKESEGYCRD